MKKKPITEYKAGGYVLRFYEAVSFTDQRWRWQLSYKGEPQADSANDQYKTLSNAKRGFRAAQKAMAKF